ncbi:efflux RND transporter permease subunit VmeI [Vibrio sp. Vb2880]|jgi:multidrug efflux pump subunit AcrB|uniref:efflux RND transporter permease subunit VmeI n=1 Tax=unclassified Vibrio TaxID=2614977 RepID=UPI0021D23BF3|nr:MULTISPECIES: efflux RND transporter permease subunit VmeI [unclassified Vibrio]EJE3286210.1 efflux RND transporter permease subunit VmeI [Vibrio alginolyticus]EJE3289689.1 efflux RND transporter permease subunit VmeI [Vibrio alginolyticus]MDW1575446.1 efflux RND transporter permease subunit VmeI [Vibrio sp. Vb2880]MDW1831273.1 efflux RND transporter permease subunit VmeI [Vibrio sp. Vb1755]MDW2146907.1 efflux RND transporter permease subunit VmeI [Vibrio sp. 378]
MSDLNKSAPQSDDDVTGIAAYFIRNRVISWMFALIFLIGGIAAFFGLGRLEDPAFTIKDAMVVTSYPGATPQQVEEEVTYPIEKAIQQLTYVDEVNSISSRGLSQITVTMKNNYGPDDLPQIWDELRRKVNDLKGTLPPGVNEPQVIDDFGDVYGILLAVTGDGYSYKELLDYVDYLRRELELVDGVSKVSVSGQQQEQVFIEVSMKKLSSIGLAPDTVFNLLSTQNVVSDAGAIRIGDEYIRIQPTGEFQSVEELGDLLITESGAQGLIFLKDVAEIKRGYVEVPNNIINFNGSLALNVGVSFAEGVNVVEVGKAFDHRLAELKYQQPVGIEISEIYSQPKEVDKSVSGFVVSLAQAVGIVIIVLLFFMGLRSGLLIGLILLLTVLGTFIFMKYLAIDLQRISLGALVIALGMLVDNAIVVVEGILIGTQKGRTRLQAATDIVTQTKWPLLGATVIAVTAFAPIGLSEDSTGEYCGTLFTVLLISLMLSWFTAISLTPFFADIFFKGQKIKQGEGEENDPYNGVIFVIYKKFLQFCMRRAWFTVVVLIAGLAASVYGFTFVKQAFFPSSTTPIFQLDVWMPEGTDIRATNTTLKELESWLAKQEHVDHITTTAGKGLQRFMLTYAPEKSYAAYGEITTRMENYEALKPLMAKFREYLKANYPEINYKLKQIELGPGGGAKIEARIIGSDPTVLRTIAAQVKDIMYADPQATNIRHDWRERTQVLEPQFNESQARRYGITKSDVDDFLSMSFSGMTIGLYRDGTTLMPIVARLPEDERIDIRNIEGMKIWSPAQSEFIPLQQVTMGYDMRWEDPIIVRKNRKRMLTVMADPDILGEETASTLQKRLQPQIEAIQMPPGYSLEWGGEYESSGDAQESLFTTMPMGYLFMFLITVFLFNSIKEPLIVWLTVPLALIGVTTGLLALNTPFGFMALLGFLSLSGMVLKNGIVLLDQIEIEMKSGKEAYDAVVDAAVSRVRPVCMAAITTILGMIPLLPDIFFKPMAVTIMFGLGFATVLTLIVVPVLYRLFHKVAVPKQA